MPLINEVSIDGKLIGWKTYCGYYSVGEGLPWRLRFVYLLER